MRAERAILGDVLIAPAGIHPLLLQGLVAELIQGDLAIVLAEAIVGRGSGIAVVPAEIPEQLFPFLAVEGRFLLVGEPVRHFQDFAAGFAGGADDRVANDSLQLLERDPAGMRGKPAFVEQSLFCSRIVLWHTIMPQYIL